MRLFVAAALSLFALSSVALAAPQQAQTERNCFRSNDWVGWSAPGDGDALLIRVRMHDVYRVDLAPGTHVRKAGDRFIVNNTHGSDMICSRLDLNMSLTDHHGFSQPLIATSIHKLSDAEVAAIPEHDRP